MRIVTISSELSQDQVDQILEETRQRFSSWCKENHVVPMEKED